MNSYTVYVPYVGYKFYDVEAENKQDAYNKAFEENKIPIHADLCFQCEEKFVDGVNINYEDIYIEENE